jgi:nucleoside-diphosphate-sugar epimerase
MIDNLSTGRFCSLFDLPERGSYRFYERDVVTENLDDLIDGAQALVHLAAITDAASSHENADKVRRTNIDGTARVAEACARRGVPMVLLSTASIYGPHGSAIDEDCPRDEIRPQSVYAESKLAAEGILRERALDSGLRYVVLRFGTIFGVSPGMRFHTAVNKFCWQASCAVPLEIWRTALEQKRPYLGIDDGSRAILHAIEADLFRGDVYNVVSVNATVADILDEIRRFIPELSITLGDHSIMNQLSYEVRCERFRRTGFEFHDSLSGGIADTMTLLSGMWRRP